MDFDPLRQDEIFRYMLLDRMRLDCEYYLGDGDHESKYSGKETDCKQGDEQFEIDDSRSLEKMYQDMSGEGLQPVLNDYL